jgi:hypothetical protein
LWPASTVAVSDASSMSTIRSMALTSSTTPPAYGTAAPITPEPPPRGTTGTPCSVARRSVAATSSSLVASTTASGSAGRPSWAANSAGHDQSRAQRARSASSVVTVPTWPRSSSMKVSRVTGAM